MTLSPLIWKDQDVRDLAKRIKAIVMQELITMEYTAVGNSFRKQFAVPLNDVLVACEEYLSLYGTDAEKHPDTSCTRTFIVN